MKVKRVKAATLMATGSWADVALCVTDVGGVTVVQQQRQPALFGQLGRDPLTASGSGSDLLANFNARFPPPAISNIMQVSEE